MEYDSVDTHIANQETPVDIAEVVVSASSRLDGSTLTLPQKKLIKVLLRLLTRAKEITSAILKESTRDYYYDYNGEKQRHICRAYSNASLAITCIEKLRELGSNYKAQEVSEAHWSMCLSRLYTSLSSTGEFLDLKTLAFEVDLTYWHAEQVLAITINAIDAIQTHVFCAGLTRKKNNIPLQFTLAAKATRILKVVNRSVNRLQHPQNIDTMSNLTVVFRTAAELNILHRLVISSESFELWPTETSIIRGLVKKRLGALQAQLLLIAASHAEMKTINGLLCQVAVPTLLYYEMVACSTLDFFAPSQNAYDSLAFCLIESFSLALETSICPFYAKNHSEEDMAAHLGMLRKIFDICNAIYTAITSYYRQLLLQATLPITAACTDCNTCSRYIESALQKVRTVASKASTYSNEVKKNLQMLEGALTESGRLCTLTLQNQELLATNGDPSNAMDDIAVLSCFYETNKESPPSLLDSIDEEMWLQGRGWGGEDTW